MHHQVWRLNKTLFFAIKRITDYTSVGIVLGQDKNKNTEHNV